MCQKPECPHKGDKMCSCAGLNFGSGNELRTHFLKNLTGMKLELSYNTLASPTPYRLCVTGTCGTCGGRLCVSARMTAHLRGEGLLAMAFGHAIHLDLNCTDQFVELFHEEDRPAVRRWLEGLYGADAKQPPQEPDAPTMVYTIVRTAVDADRGIFDDPSAMGSDLNYERAQERLAKLIAEEKKTLSGHYDTEKLLEDSWEISEADYAAAHFVRIEILSSELSCGGEGGAL